MPTITIHLSNPDDVGDLITNVLRYCTNPVITIDLSGDPTMPTTTTKPATRVATSEHHPVIDSVMEASQRSTPAAKRQRAKAKDAYMRTHHDDLISVYCPACGAEADEVCHSPGGHNYGPGFVHNDRIQARVRRLAGFQH